MSRKLFDALPPALREIEEMRQLTLCSEQPEVAAAEAALSAVLSNQFVKTADDFGLARFEDVLSIVPKATLSLEERRFAVTAQFMDNRPTTLLFLKQQLEVLCGAGGYTLQLHATQYTLTVRLALAKKSQFQAVAELIGRIKPANIMLDLDLLYNRHSLFFGGTHAQLTQYTHEAMRSEVI